MTDKTIALKIVRYAKSRNHMAMIKLIENRLSAVVNNNRGKQYYVCAMTWKELIHKLKGTVWI
jgi:hypothetical protein